MSAAREPERIIIDVKRLVESDKRSEIRLNANGGNSILLVCPPNLEHQFIVKLHELMDEDYSIIDLNKILLSFVDSNQNHLPEMFDLLRGSVPQIFKSPVGETGSDLFSIILAEIESAYKSNKIPVLINSGALYGSGIDNIHLMENELVMKSKKPLIILYPATQEGDQLMFLNSRPSSKYRCMIVN